MIEFLCSSDLWVSIVGGVVTAGLIALIAYLWNRRRHKILRELTEIMGKAIQHRNVGEQKAFTDQNQWVQNAKSIQQEAVAKATELSSTAGSLVEWLDRVDPWNMNNEVERHVSFLSKVIERIRQLLERNS
jgi:hypothetical protein